MPSYVILSVDPGLAHTGWAVARITGRGKKATIEILDIGTITTDSKAELQDRFNKITNKLEDVINEHGVKRMVCEAFESRPWQEPRKGANSMSKLVNRVSEIAYRRKILFLLSSPDVKKLAEWKKEVPELTYGLKKHSGHVDDAIMHLVQTVREAG